VVVGEPALRRGADAPILLVATGDRLGNRAVFKRPGYLIDVLELDQPILLSACEKRLSSGISTLEKHYIRGC
jgi:hypothetical protein